MRMYDVTLPIAHGMPVYPGDPEVVIRPWPTGPPVALSRLSLGAHTGTHVDAPRHFREGAPGVDRLPLEALIGPDILALQTMLFLKGPGKPGQGFHQDSYYIPTYPDSLCGAWLAIDDVDEENGCMYFTPGSQHEPIYPPAEGYGHLSLARNRPGRVDWLLCWVPSGLDWSLSARSSRGE